MQCIRTKFCAPTNHKGARIIASCDARRIIVSYKHELNRDDAHLDAARELAGSLGWVTPFGQEQPFDGDRYAIASGWFGDECFHVLVRK